MTDIPKFDLEYHAESEVDLGTTHGGTSIPFHVESFGGTSHIAPSIHVVEASSHAHPRPSVSNPIQIPESRRLNIGNTNYIPSHVPSSSTPIPSNSFLTTHSPPNSHGISGRNTATSHIHSNPIHTIVS